MYKVVALITLTHIFVLDNRATTMDGFATNNLHERVFQHNNLARAPMRLSNIEARIFALCLGCLHQHSDSLAVEVSIKDVLTKVGGEGYERVKQGCIVLNSTPINIETVGKKGLRTFVSTPIFAELRLEEGSGLLTGCFNEKLRSHLLELNEYFATCALETLLTLKSAYAHRLYWILKSWEKPLGFVSIERQQLRDMLQGTEQPQSYPLWADFKRFVLEPAMKELHAIEWPVSYEEKRRGRTVSAVSFIIPIEKQEVNTKAGEFSLEDIEAYKVKLKDKYAPLLEQYQRMQLDFGLSEFQARKLCDHIANMDLFHKLTKTLYDVNTARRDNKKMESLVQYTMNKLSEAFPEVFPKENKKASTN